jgi:hypothetical protein
MALKVFLMSRNYMTERLFVLQQALQFIPLLYFDVCRRLPAHPSGVHGPSCRSSHMLMMPRQQSRPPARDCAPLDDPLLDTHEWVRVAALRSSRKGWGPFLQYSPRNPVLAPYFPLQTSYVRMRPKHHRSGGLSEERFPTGLCTLLTIPTAAGLQGGGDYVLSATST